MSRRRRTSSISGGGCHCGQPSTVGGNGGDVGRVTLRAAGQRIELSGRLRQTQAGPPFSLRVPLVLSVAGDERARLHTLSMSAREQTFTLPALAEPLHLTVDPAHDLMRIPKLEELPPSVET